MGKYKSPRGQDLIAAVNETKHLEGDFAEAGVYTGNSAQVICAVKENKILHLFDTFKGLPGSLFEPIDSSTEIARFHVRPGMYAASLE